MESSDSLRSPDRKEISDIPSLKNIKIGTRTNETRKWKCAVDMQSSILSNPHNEMKIVASFDMGTSAIHNLGLLKILFVSWYFEHSQPQRITSGLKQTSICLLLINLLFTHVMKPQIVC